MRQHSATQFYLGLKVNKLTGRWNPLV